ncbi:ISNCY family transposase [Thermanaerothrix sp. 4228-RoL]|uniref:ISNCY family transposase n=1 Tax=Thermanaerothrix solaris TaxID=3058434 RepID=A0ABU3NJM2_9CHLR|nr:ISNCY family transposase [Thermanaerothrix sp. 4228-RoL]MDT8896997.1 ISNCY family transposase [Thermanaerothrix sp. 4228-RoL]
MDELLKMSNQEITRLETMQRIKEKRLTQIEAARLLDLSVRQIKRLYRAYKTQGAAGLVSRRRGKPSNHRLKEETQQKVLDLLYQRYADFGPTLAHEKLTEQHHLSISRESVRKIMIAEGLWKPRRAKRPPLHPMRQRRACVGELVQIDGSDHAWFEERGPTCTLLVFVDDATGQLMELWFVPDETFFAYCEATRHYLERYGKPLAFYSDQHGIFRVNQPRPLATTPGLTQFGRAMQELDIQILCAHSPQAKGRVERANQTLQDRLVKELRLREISDIQTANAFLPEFREDFNRRFAVTPRSSHNAHRPLLPTDDLDRILTHQETRTLSKNLTVQFKQTIYQIQSDRPAYALRHAHVTVCENPHGDVTILYQNQPLAYSIYQKPARQADIVDTKTLDRQIKTPPSPAPNHPWRRYGHHLNGKPIQEASPHDAD